MCPSAEAMMGVVAELTRRLRALEAAERSEQTGGVARSTVANLPALAGAAVEAGRLYFATNGRKTGEGVAAGTGVLVYADGNNANWRRVDDGTQVAA